MTVAFSQKLLEFRKLKGLSQKELGVKIGNSQQAIGHYERGIREPSFVDIQTLSQVLSCSPGELMGSEERMAFQLEQQQIILVNKHYVDSQQNDLFVELPFVSIQARTTFAEILGNEKNYGLADTLRIVANEPLENYRGQIVIEIDGDCMGPRLCMGDRVRCRYVPLSDWPFLPAGVYAVSFSNYFVVKRIKSNELQTRQFLTLHSDNGETGGSLDVPRAQLHHVWHVLDIVGGLVR